MRASSLALVFLFLLVSPSSSHAQYTTSANILSTAAVNGGLSVSNFDPRPASETPGNVGLCFSGGGSRALSATMGQLRALNQMGLLSQVKAMSSVSGGSWATVPFTFLPSTISDDEFLGPYVANPADLHVTGIFGGSTASQLDTLSTYNLGSALNNMGTADNIANSISLLSSGIPPHRLWTHIVGQNILGTFGLSSFDSNFRPNKFFCSHQTVCEQIYNANSANFIGYYPISTNSIRRPFHIINTAMFVNVPSLQAPSGFQYLAPFHATPYYAGIPSSPPGAVSTRTGNAVGGGTVQSYAFGGLLQTNGDGDGSSVSIQQNSPFSLADITGSSSAFFAEVVQNDVTQYVSSADELDPHFNYFSMADVASNAAGGMERFSDAGTLDNSGVCAMLQYNDIDNLIVFINSERAISYENGAYHIDSSIAALFGYQPFANGGYERFPSPSTPMTSTDMSVEFRFNQVFESSQFQTLIDGLVGASTNNGQSPLSTAPAIFLQTGLQVLSNSWWGISGGKTVNVLWVYNQAASQFTSQLAWTVRTAMSSDFPNYSTFNTGLSNLDINLLAHFTAWNLMQMQSTVQSMFSSSNSFAASGAEPEKHNIVTIAAIAAASTVAVVGIIFAAIMIYRRRHRSLEETEMSTLSQA